VGKIEGELLGAGVGVKETYVGNLVGESLGNRDGYDDGPGVGTRLL